MDQNTLKRNAALKALDFLPEKPSVIGVGTGSTVNYFIDALAQQRDRIDAAVSSSVASTERLKAAGIQVLELNAVGDIALYVDGADEINHHMHMIKGGGGALTREKKLWQPLQRPLFVLRMNQNTSVNWENFLSLSK